MMTQRQFLDILLPLQPTLRLVAERLLGDREDAKDAVQETYVRLWEQRRKLAQHANPEAYAMLTLKNHCISLLRQRRPFENMEQLPEVSDEDARHVKYLDCKSHDEMRQALGMSSANVYTTLSRAVANLKQMISHGR